MTKLSKEVCKKCMDHRYPSYAWRKEDEDFWTKDQVWCGGYVFKQEVFPNTAIPPHCPYALEHITQENQ